MKFQKFFFILLIIIFIINITFFNVSYAAEFSVDSPAVILFNCNTGSILYQKNAYTKMYPASTTKIITAILTIENCNLEDTTTVSSKAVNLPDGYVGASLQVGEIFTINDLLHLLLLVSANDAANVLAEHIGISADNFVNMMNLKAQEIGCLNTNFTNPYGYHNENHYSTAYDLCLIANYAMKNNIFRQIVSTTTYTTSATNMSEARILHNTNLLLQDINPYTNNKNIFKYEYAIGIKTGYTTQAKNCLVASAKKDGIEYISVVLGAQANETEYSSQRYSDTRKLFTNAFENYSMSLINKANDVITNIEISNGDAVRKNLDLILENDIEILISHDDLEKGLTPNISLYEDKLQAPIAKGDVLGTIEYTYNGITYTSNLLAATSVSTEKQIHNYLKIAVGGFLILLTFSVLKKNKKNRKK